MRGGEAAEASLKRTVAVQTHGHGAADGPRVARMTSVNVPEMMNELRDGVSRPFNTATGRGGRSVLEIPVQPCRMGACNRGARGQAARPSNSHVCWSPTEVSALRNNGTANRRLIVLFKNTLASDARKCGPTARGHCICPLGDDVDRRSANMKPKRRARPGPWPPGARRRPGTENNQ